VRLRLEEQSFSYQTQYERTKTYERSGVITRVVLNRVGWHTARTLLPPPPLRSSGAPVGIPTVAHGKRAARERRHRRSKASRRRRAGHAPPARCGRRVRVPRAVKRPAKTLCGGVGGGGGSNSELPQAGFP
jgi:hypothetical protein